MPFQHAQLNPRAVPEEKLEAIRNLLPYLGRIRRDVDHLDPHPNRRVTQRWIALRCKVSPAFVCRFYQAWQTERGSREESSLLQNPDNIAEAVRKLANRLSIPIG